MAPHRVSREVRYHYCLCLTGDIIGKPTEQVFFGVNYFWSNLTELLIRIPHQQHGKYESDEQNLDLLHGLAPLDLHRGNMCAKHLKSKSTPDLTILQSTAELHLSGIYNWHIFQVLFLPQSCVKVHYRHLYIRSLS